MLTYPEVGATRSDRLPSGYHILRRHVPVGHGRAAFQAAADALRRWEVQRGAGLQVRTAAAEVAVGVGLSVGVGAWRLRIWAPGEVVWVDADPDRYGFAYGTLAGHPESGEEAFVVTYAADGTVWFDICAFSRPATWYAKLGGPVTGWLQSRITERYVRALQRAANASAQ